MKLLSKKEITLEDWQRFQKEEELNCATKFFSRNDIVSIQASDFAFPYLKPISSTDFGKSEKTKNFDYGEKIFNEARTFSQEK